MDLELSSQLFYPVRLLAALGQDTLVTLKVTSSYQTSYGAKDQLYLLPLISKFPSVINHRET